MLPDCRLIAVLRNPLERAFSVYLNRWRDGEERRSFLEVLGDEASAEPILRGGFYGRHLERYLEHFDSDQILIELYDDFSRHPAEVVKRIYSHIGVDPTFMPDLSLKANISAGGVARIVNSAMQIVRTSRAKPIIDRLTPVPWRRRVVRVLQRLAERDQARIPDPEPAAMRLLGDIYADDIRLAADLVDQPLERWLEYPQ
jgi:hypothetical protein